MSQVPLFLPAPTTPSAKSQVPLFRSYYSYTYFTSTFVWFMHCFFTNSCLLFSPFCLRATNNYCSIRLGEQSDHSKLQIYFEWFCFQLTKSPDQSRWTNRVIWYLLVLSILATSKVIWGWGPSCESVHSWLPYSASPLGSTMTQPREKTM